MNRIVKPILVISFWICCAIVLPALSIVATCFVIGGEDIAHMHISGIIASILSLLVLCLPYKFYCPSEILPRKKLNVNYSIGAVICGFVVFVICHFWLLMFVKDIELSDLSFTGVLYSVLAFGLLGPIAEELFFRQWVVGYLAKYKYSNIAQMLVSSVIFCLIHLLPKPIDGAWAIPYWRIDTLLFGILQYWVFVKTRDVRYCIIIHVVYNLCARFVPLLF